MKATNYGDELTNEDRLIVIDAVKIFGMFKGKITEDYLKRHKYVKFSVDDIVSTENSENKFVVGFECLYLHEYFKFAIDILKAFDFGDDDIEIYIPKEEYPMIITVSDEYKNKKGEKIYLLVAQRLVDPSDKKSHETRFLLKELNLKKVK